MLLLMLTNSTLERPKYQAGFHAVALELHLDFKFQIQNSISDVNHDTCEVQRGRSIDYETGCNADGRCYLRVRNPMVSRPRLGYEHPYEKSLFLTAADVDDGSSETAISTRSCQ